MPIFKIVNTIFFKNKKIKREKFITKEVNKEELDNFIKMSYKEQAHCLPLNDFYDEVMEIFILTNIYIKDMNINYINKKLEDFSSRVIYKEIKGNEKQ